MRRGSGPPIGGEIASGVAGATAFLAMVFLLQMPLWLSAPLAAGVYAGTWFATRRDPRDPMERLTAADLVRRIEQAAAPVANARVRQKIAATCEQADGVLAFFAQHPEKAANWRPILRECLRSTLRIVERYAELSRFAEDPGRYSLRELEGLLDQVAATLASVRARLVDEGAADLSAEIDVFRSTLQALNEVNVLNRGGRAP